jgi:hypothetical protein
MIDPVEEPKRLVDSFVSRTPSVSAKLLRTEGIVSRSSDRALYNDLAAKLAVPERELLAQLLEHERRTAIFDALVVLHEAQVGDEIELRKDGVVVPVEPFGYTIFEEYLALQDGDWGDIE